VYTELAPLQSHSCGPDASSTRRAFRYHPPTRLCLSGVVYAFAIQKENAHASYRQICEARNRGYLIPHNIVDTKRGLG
jgi:hypothetical protein